MSHWQYENILNHTVPKKISDELDGLKSKLMEELLFHYIIGGLKLPDYHSVWNTENTMRVVHQLRTPISVAPNRPMGKIINVDKNGREIIIDDARIKKYLIQYLAIRTGLLATTLAAAAYAIRTARASRHNTKLY